MSRFIDNLNSIKIESIDSDWLQVQIGNQIFVLSYDAAVDIASLLALTTAKMDENSSILSETKYLN